MLKYSTYNSIYKPVYAERSRRSGLLYHWRPSRSLLLKLLIISIAFWLGGAGCYSVFAGSLPADESATKVVVAPGDTLWAIAAEYKPVNFDIRIYIEGIEQVNGLNGGQIQAGQILKMPEF